MELKPDRTPMAIGGRERPKTIAWKANWDTVYKASRMAFLIAWASIFAMF